MPRIPTGAEFRKEFVEMSRKTMKFSEYVAEKLRKARI